MKTRPPVLLAVAAISLVVFFLVQFLVLNPEIQENTQGSVFNAERAYRDVIFQVEQGPRTPGSPGREAVVDWIGEDLSSHHWSTSKHREIYQGVAFENLIGQREGSDEEAEKILIGAHYDTRLFADRDPDLANREEPVPGANDGASGVAVLLEIARVIPSDLPAEIWLVFFDAEDNGGIGSLDWSLGSQGFVRDYVSSGVFVPDSVIIIDMIGDADLNLYTELNSDPVFANEIWELGAALGYEEYFLPVPKYRMTDDHLPFVNAGITTILIIDFDYPYWHTTADTPDKVSPTSLKVIGDTLLAWLSD